MSKMIKVIATATIVTLIGCAEEPTQTVNDATVTKSERIMLNGLEQYMVYTDRGVFKNTDSPKHGKYNSADLYAEIKEGAVCSFMLVGKRNPKRSQYQNILQMECK